MKKYICFYRIDCSWADEIPPREFTLAGNGDENVCPNCESSNIREKPVPAGPPKGKIAAYVAGVLLIAGILYLMFRNPSVIDEPNNGDSTTTSNVPLPPKTNGDNTAEGKEKEKKRPLKQAKAVTWNQVAGSEFCVGDCIVAYTETDNLGHTRERRIENYEKCCPADK